MIVAHQIKKHYADPFNASFAPAIPKLAGDIAYKASQDQNLRSFATPHDQAVGQATLDNLY